jgi:DNA repair protein RadC
VADPKIIYQIALKANACSIILAHNHPPGNINPSEADIQLTRKMVECGKFLDLPVLDHLILTSEGFYSFADEGLI